VAKRVMTEAAESGSMDLTSLLADDKFIEFIEA
jgi:hypothetical protein